MKGQYLALEAVLTIGLGVSLAIAVITLAGTFTSNAENRLKEEQAEIVYSKTVYGIDKVKQSSVARKEISLPSDLGGSDYRISASGEDLIISSGGERYVFELEAYARGVKVIGSSEGQGELTLFKQDNQIRIAG